MAWCLEEKQSGEKLIVLPRVHEISGHYPQENPTQQYLAWSPTNHFDPFYSLHESQKDLLKI